MATINFLPSYRMDVWQRKVKLPMDAVQIIRYVYFMKSLYIFLLIYLFIVLPSIAARAVEPVNIDAPLPYHSGTQSVPLTVRAYGSIEDLRAAANQGNADAELGLGFAYINGEGIEKNRDEGVRWLQKYMEQTTHRPIDPRLLQINGSAHSVRYITTPPSSSSRKSSVSSSIQTLLFLGLIVFRLFKRKKKGTPTVSAATLALEQDKSSAKQRITRVDKKVQQHIITFVLRLTGAAFLGASLAIYYDFQGLGSALGVDEQAKMIFCSIVFALGIINYLVLPPILAKKAGLEEQS